MLQRSPALYRKKKFINNKFLFIHIQNIIFVHFIVLRQLSKCNYYSMYILTTSETCTHTHHRINHIDTNRGVSLVQIVSYRGIIRCDLHPYWETVVISISNGFAQRSVILFMRRGCAWVCACVRANTRSHTMNTSLLEDKGRSITWFLDPIVWPSVGGVTCSRDIPIVSWAKVKRCGHRRWVCL